MNQFERLELLIHEKINDIYNFDGEFTYIEDNEVKTSFIIPNGYYFVVGDNRINSNDSRKIGLVKEDNIEGVVWFELSSSGLERVK